MNGTTVDHPWRERWKELSFWQKALVVFGVVMLVGLIGSAFSDDEETQPAETTARVEEASSEEPERTEASPDTVPDDIETGEADVDVEVPDTTLPPDATEEAAAADLPRGVILSVLEDNEPWFATVPRATTVDLIVATCDALDDGTTLEEIVLIGMQSDVPETATGAMIVAATTGWCPEHAGLVDEFMATWGP